MEVDEIMDSVIERPDFYFDTKEHNMEKLIEKKLTKIYDKLKADGKTKKKNTDFGILTIGKYIKNKEPKSLILYFKFFYVICILKF